MLVRVLVALLLATVVVATLPSASMQTSVVNRHNLHRAQSSLVPQAVSPLPPLTWNATLATYANNFAEGGGCNGFHHNPLNQYGENIGASSATLSEAYLLDSTDMWNNEKQYYNITTNTCSLAPCGHYTQVVWNTTTQIGCAFKQCSSGSPWGGGSWTLTICNYSPRGNTYFYGEPGPRIPYTPSSSSCTPSCPAGACGTISSCGQSISCTCAAGSYCNAGTCTACPNPCTSNSCGSLTSSQCPTYSVNCGNCASGFNCASNVCTAPPPSCNVATACAAIGVSCGSANTQCGTATNCGTCPSGQTCTSGVCVAPPCNGQCSSPSQTCNTQTNNCQCAAGYSLVNGVCQVSTNGPPVWTTDFQLTTTGGTLSIPSTSLVVSGPGEQVVRYVKTTAAVNPYYMKVRVEATATTGSVGLVFRHGQTGNNAANDGIYLQFNNIGTANTQFVYKRKRNGNVGWTGTYSLPTEYWNVNGVTVLQGILTQNDSTSQYGVDFLSNAAGYQFGFGLADSLSNLPSAGRPAFVFTPSAAGSSIQKLTVSSATVLQVSLYSCINSADWSSLFYSLTGANPALVALQVRAVGENARCKAAGAKEAASAFFVVIESSGMASEAIATNFIAAVEGGSAAAAPLAVKTVGVVGGTEGAILAGAAFAPTVVAPAAGGAGGGGGAAGLSGGAIAGIVVGSVAGAVLIVGVTAIVVAAVIVAAVVVAKKSGDDDSSSGATRSDEDSSKRGSLRKTLYNVFRGPRGGVDVMNNPKGHQSITARAPAM